MFNDQKRVILEDNAKNICVLYIKEESPYEINISQTTKQKISNIVLNNNDLLSREVFDESIFEVKRMLMTHFNCFLESKLYAVYHNSLIQVESLINE